MNVFVTGGRGYIGGAVTRMLAESGAAVRAGIRAPAEMPSWVEPVVTGDLAVAAPRFDGDFAVIHAAGLGHRTGVPVDEWRRANIDAAVNVARAARMAGVQRFVLISTAHVHGRVHAGIVRDDTAPNPMDDYAASKLAAEAAVAAAFGTGLTVIRPTAVIGPGCPGNLQLLMKFLAARRPLPFGWIRNQRSFIQVNDLARLVLAVIAAQAPPGAVLAAHPVPIGTPALIRALGRGMGVKANLLPFPPALLGLGARVAGRGAMWQSLAGSFIADPQNAVALGWRPRENLTDSLEKTGAAFVVS